MSDTATIYSDVPDNDTMGGRMLRARDAAGLSLAELARRLGVQSNTVQAWENDRSQPRANRLSMLAGVLDVSLSWLLHGVGAGPNDESRAELYKSVSLQLERLRRLQSESAKVAAKIERDMQRLTSGA
ncbi:helix-turn-helix transcriptional regulator [Mesorhizobium sp. Z1-4]|uniref:helix-turn-helix domain-containing protein n=1 Tax=Mesorhizobium sp. Z1-4 TaxID=2448478 RepID=UPI0013E0DE0C|nr:helix-turn-helix transcriptional regulator [Mesorhizobium sp. Z1-4]